MPRQREIDKAISNIIWMSKLRVVPAPQIDKSLENGSHPTLEHPAEAEVSTGGSSFGDNVYTIQNKATSCFYSQGPAGYDWYSSSNFKTLCS